MCACLVVTLKYPLVFLGPSPRWDLWSFGHSGAGLGAPEVAVEHCLCCARDWQTLLGWDRGSGGIGVTGQGSAGLTGQGMAGLAPFSPPHKMF